MNTVRTDEKQITCDGVIVDYRYNGVWKHKEVIVKKAEEYSDPSLLSNESVLDMLVTTDPKHQMTHDNIVCFHRIRKWNNSLEELEKYNEDIGNFELLRGRVIELFIVNENLYKEWLKPERVM